MAKRQFLARSRSGSGAQIRPTTKSCPRRGWISHRSNSRQRARALVQVMSKVIRIEFPSGFEDYDWEVEAKGWIPRVVAVIQGRRYTLTVYEPARLAQDVADALKEGAVFLERNLVIVASVTRESIASAIQEIVQTGRVDDLQPDQGDAG